MELVLTVSQRAAPCARCGVRTAWRKTDFDLVSGTDEKGALEGDTQKVVIAFSHRYRSPLCIPCARKPKGLYS